MRVRRLARGWGMLLPVVAALLTVVSVPAGSGYGAQGHVIQAPLREGRGIGCKGSLISPFVVGAVTFTQNGSALTAKYKVMFGRFPLGTVSVDLVQCQGTTQLSSTQLATVNPNGKGSVSGTVSTTLAPSATSYFLLISGGGRPIIGATAATPIEPVV